LNKPFSPPFVTTCNDPHPGDPQYQSRCAAYIRAGEERARAIDTRTKADIPNQQTQLNNTIEWLNSVKVNIVNIRQQRYDEENNTRYCEGNFDGLDVPHFRQQLGSMARDFSVYDDFGSSYCINSIRYKIERLVDKKNFYVSWSCS
jgi:hypothetical protein